MEIQPVTKTTAYENRSFTKIILLLPGSDNHASTPDVRMLLLFTS